MTLNDRPATWLELAAVAAQGGSARIALHAVSDCGATCVVIQIDGRTLHDGQGRITVFHSPEVIHRFLACCGFSMPPPEFGKPDVETAVITCGDNTLCLDLGRKGRLVACGRSCRPAPR